MGRKRETFCITLDPDVVEKIKCTCDPDVPLSRCIERKLKENLEK